MGLLTASSTFVRYKVEGTLPDNFMDFADGQITRFAFRDIDWSMFKPFMISIYFGLV